MNANSTLAKNWMTYWLTLLYNNTCTGTGGLFPPFWYSTNKLYSEWSFDMHIVDLSSLSNFQKGYSIRLTERVENSIFDMTGAKTWHVATITKRSGWGLGEELIGFMCGGSSFTSICTGKKNPLWTEMYAHFLFWRMFFKKNDPAFSQASSSLRNTLYHRIKMWLVKWIIPGPPSFILLSVPLRLPPLTNLLIADVVGLILTTDSILRSSPCGVPTDLLGALLNFFSTFLMLASSYID